MDARGFFSLAVFLYTAGGLLALLFNRAARTANLITGLSACMASISGIISAILVFTTGAGFSINASGWLPLTRFIIDVDQLSAFMVLVICFLAAATSLYSISYLNEYKQKNPGLLGLLYNLFIASMVLVVTVGNALYFLIFWEVMTLVSYFLVIYERDQRSINGGFLYFLVAHAGTSLIMVALLVFSAKTGSFDFSAFRKANLSPVLSSVIFVLAFTGFSAKAGAVPLHFWLPEAHSAAPSNVSSLLSGVMIKTAIYGIIRVCVDFLGAGYWWWGFLVLAVGTVSAVLGVIYALAQHDIKRLLAFHSVENIGIILMGVGTGIIGLATGNPALMTLGLLAGLYHTFNHAVFKGLLFLGAGSVLYRTHTRNFEELGGLARKMPFTALFFLTGAISISALPPLNGFVSEWFTFQSLLSMGVRGGLADKFWGPLFAALLALASALTAMCFVKTYGITFAGPFRTSKAEVAVEVPFSMILGKFLLAIGCLVLGLGAPALAPRIAGMATDLVGSKTVSVATGLTTFAGNPAQGMLSTPLLSVLLAGLLFLPLLIVAVFGRSGSHPRIDPTPWACGYRYEPAMACTARSFAQVMQSIFHPLYTVKTSFKGKKAAGEYFQTSLVYEVQEDDMWTRYCGRPLARGVLSLSRTLQNLQMGNVRFYCFYIIAVLVILLAVIGL
ncbi:MAG TPA: hydrogenase 4 subunit B [Syntrophomonadaceae bacterium]|nr:hydrogenase 4 subunit B [Syntrophomonadaceae bacterium]